MNHVQGYRKNFEPGKLSTGGGIDTLAGWSRRWGQPRLLLHNRSPATRLGHGSSGLLQTAHDEILDPHVDEAVVPRLGPQKEPIIVFGADLLVIV